jgi:thiol-disulfide isomerase/thioredoxin
MKIRWTLAVAGALALGLLTAGQWRLSDSAEAAAGGAEVCDANAKPADLNLTLKDMSNKDVSLASFKGKVIVLNFWATWCGPCKVEIPSFVDLQSQYGKNGLQIIGVSVDDTLDKLKSFTAQIKMNYPVLQGLGRDDVQDAFGPIFGVPTTVVISRAGDVCRKHVGVSSKEEFEKEIKALL